MLLPPCVPIARPSSSHGTDIASSAVCPDCDPVFKPKKLGSAQAVWSQTHICIHLRPPTNHSRSSPLSPRAPTPQLRPCVLTSTLTGSRHHRASSFCPAALPQSAALELGQGVERLGHVRLDVQLGVENESHLALLRDDVRLPPRQHPEHVPGDAQSLPQPIALVGEDGEGQAVLARERLLRRHRVS